MKLQVLIDNNTYIDKYYLGEPALSFYIEDEGKKILFDTGYSDALITNSKLMNISLNKIDYLVLSHGHNDHTGGLRFLNNINNTTLVAHPDVFQKRNNEGLEIGSFLEKDDLNVKEVVLTKNVFKITSNLYFLGEIERIHDFENRTVGFLKNNTKDKVIDDSALAYITDKGLFIITGCSHSGIANICDTAKKLLNNNNIIGIIGGFHIFNDDNQIENTIKYFKDNKIDDLYPCHCVSLYAKAKMMKELNVHEVGVGLEINI